jgi:uncharacterized SAM-binding protein YcdF (DUF218 family)
MNDKTDQELAKIIWEYHHLNQTIKPSDLILVLCSHDLRVADFAADLFNNNYAPYIIFSGGVAHQNDLLSTNWNGLSEAEKFAQIAIDKGVPKEKIFIEDKATNTGENIKLAYQIIQDRNLKADKIILIQKPYMERRTYATFMKQWPGKNTQIFIATPKISFEEYPNEEINFETMVNIMLGDLQRIKYYPEKGFQIYQEIPENVWVAFEELVKRGYDKHLMK